MHGGQEQNTETVPERMQIMYSNISVHRHFCLQAIQFASKRIEQNFVSTFKLHIFNKHDEGHLAHTNTNTAIFLKIVK